MERKGFTLVELIVVIVIIGVLAVILIPTITSSSKNSKEKILATKVETTNQALVLWAQNNRKCFFSDATSYGDECLIGLNKGCGKKLDNPNVLQCEVSYGTLAEFGIIKYDDENNNVVINPTNNNSMNSEKVTLEYNLNTKNFCNGVGCTKDVTTTKKVLEVPELIVNPESDEEWSESKIINVTVSGGTSGLSQGGTIEYGFSESQTKEPEYTNYPLVYADGDNNTTFNVVGSNLTGKYYLWLKPNITSKNGIRLQNKVTGPYYFDNPNLTVNLLATKNGLNTKVESNVWSDTGLNYKLSLEEDNSNYTIYYCKDTENTCNPNTSVANNAQITDYNGVTGEYYIRYKVVTKVGNSSEISSYHAKVDTAKPTVKVTGYKYNASGTNKVGDKVVNQITYTGDATFKISDNWVNYGATFEFVSTSTSGIKSIVWKWNSEGSSTDTGNTYPSANASNQISPFTTKYATLTGAGFRKGQWVVTSNAGKTTTITVVVKIDTCSSDTTTSYSEWSWGACSKTCGTGTQTGTRTKTIKSKFGEFTCSTTTETESQNCNTQACPIYLLNKIKPSTCNKNPKTKPGEQAPSTNEGIFCAADDYGDSYYYRGAVNNNYVVFNNMCWRIVRITGNDSIKLVLYNYSSSNCNQTGDTLAFAYKSSYYCSQGASPYNNYPKSAKDYISYMTGTNNCGNNCKYADLFANTANSELKNYLDGWYYDNLRKQTDKIADVIWCNDRSLKPSGPDLSVSIRDSYSYRAAWLLSKQDSPTLVCPNYNIYDPYNSKKKVYFGNVNRFTVSDTTYGNGKLTYPIGILTVDEMLFAGSLFRDVTYYTSGNPSYSCNSNVSKNYLYANAKAQYWTPTPIRTYYSSYGWSNEVQHIIMGKEGCLLEWDDNMGACNYVRPAIALKSNVEITSNSQTGTASNPYVIK